MDSDCNFYIFREGRSRVPAARLLAVLREALERVSDEQSCIDALLRCGELECGLADNGSAAAPALAAATEACADALVSGGYRRATAAQGWLPAVLDGTVEVSAPEGFAYYSLHPRQYAEVVKKIPEQSDAVVIGIRSIGTTLSALTAAALRQRGSRVVRFSVRPGGDPFNRKVEWLPEQLAQVEDGLCRMAQFLIVDEGPGLSGSSFLAVAEALYEGGVAKERITLIPSHQPEPTSLCADDAARRWAQFGCVPVPQCMRLEGDWIGAGEWRRKFIGADDACWPGAWTTMERAKFLSCDGRVFWKFEGLGPYGARARAQAKALAEQDFGARVLEDEAGFIGYECIEGAPFGTRDLPKTLDRIASYCAFRAENFGSNVSAEQQRDLETTLRVNFEREFGEVLPLGCASLELVKPIICDAKMSPHEWVRTESGRLLKFDATAHGDDHFFPGPCDAAWDLAGAIVEWQMDPGQCDAFLNRYRELTGDDASRRILNYLLAYAVFRMAWTKTAAGAMRGTTDEQRLRREYRRYRADVERLATVSAHR